MSTVSSLELLTSPMGPYHNFVGDEPLFAEKPETDRPALPAEMELVSPEYITKATLTQDEQGRFIGASILQRPHNTVSEAVRMASLPGMFSPMIVILPRPRARQVEMERTWIDELSFEELVSGPDGVNRRKVEFTDEDTFHAVMSAYTGQNVEVWAERKVNDATGEALWQMHHAQGIDITARDAAGRLTGSSISTFEREGVHKQIASYEYDEDGTLLQAIQSGAGAKGQSRITQFERTGSSAIHTVTLLDATTPGNVVIDHREDREYDAENRLARVTTDRSFLPQSIFSTQEVLEVTY